MSPLEIRDAIVLYWSTNYTSTSVEYIGYDFSPTYLKDTFVQFSIGFGESYSVGKGNNVGKPVITRDTGMIRVLVKVPLVKLGRKQGDREALELASNIRDILETTRIAGSIVTRAGSIHDVGVVDEYYNVAVSVPFLET